MRIFVVLVLVLCGCQAVKESVDNNYADLLSDKLIQKIEKRLQQWEGPDAPNPVPQEIGNVVTNAGKLSCHFTLQEDTIIRTKDSLDAGATYQSAPSVTSREDCRKECCQLGTKCNLAVFKDKKGDNSCYLFDCGTPNICNFSSHAGYVAMHVSRWMDDQQQIVDQHEDALEQLATDKPTTAAMVTFQNEGPQAGLNSQKNASTRGIPFPLQAVETTSTSVKLKWDRDEAVFSAHCVPPDGVENAFVLPAPEYTFSDLMPHTKYLFYVVAYSNHGVSGTSENISVTTEDDVPSKYPDAIVSPVGASINVTWKSLSPSDARGLVTQYKVVYRKHGSQTKKMVTVPGSSTEYVISDVEPGQSYDVRVEAGTSAGYANLGDNGWSTTTVLKESQGRPCSKFQFACTSGLPRCIAIYDACDGVDHCSDGSDEKTCGTDSIVTDGHQGDAGQQSAQDKEQGSTKPKESNSKSEDSSSEVTVLSSTEKPAGGATSTKTPQEPEKSAEVPAAPVPEKKSSADGDVKIPGHLLKVDDETRKTKLQNIRFNQTAILVLALGLSITALLLIFAGCRLRTVKRRLRKGRPLNSNEADYLINGMYL